MLGNQFAAVISTLCEVSDDMAELAPDLDLNLDLGMFGNETGPNLVLKMMNFVLKLMKFVFKMMNRSRRRGEDCGKHRFSIEN